MAVVKMYTGGVLSTYTNVTIDNTHEVVIEELDEAIEWDMNATDDSEDNEITAFVGPRPKKN